MGKTSLMLVKKYTKSSFLSKIELRHFDAEKNIDRKN